MDVSNAANVLAGTILTALAIIIICITIVIINNILSKYWKPVRWVRFDDPPRFLTHEELAEQQSAPKVEPK